MTTITKLFDGYTGLQNLTIKKDTHGHIRVLGAGEDVAVGFVFDTRILFELFMKQLEEFANRS